MTEEEIPTAVEATTAPPETVPFSEIDRQLAEARYGSLR